jgi:hypothetical protein
MNIKAMSVEAIKTHLDSYREGWYLDGSTKLHQGRGEHKELTAKKHSPGSISRRLEFKEGEWGCSIIVKGQFLGISPSMSMSSMSAMCFISCFSSIMNRGFQ